MTNRLSHEVISVLGGHLLRQVGVVLHGASFQMLVMTTSGPTSHLSVRSSPTLLWSYLSHAPAASKKGAGAGHCDLVLGLLLSMRNVQPIERRCVRPTIVCVGSQVAPPRLQATGGGYVSSGGLQLNPGSSEIFSPGGTHRSDPVLFELSYYGYRDPVESIRVTALSYYVGPGQGPYTVLGRRHVTLNDTVDTSGFVPITDVFGTWVERGAWIQLNAQAITPEQVSRFIANLSEEPPPKNVTQHNSDRYRLDDRSPS